MAADMEAASLKVKIGTEGDDVAGKNVESLGKKIDGVGQGAVKTGTMMTLGLTTPILAFGAAAIMSSSNTEEAQAKVNTVFGDSSNIMSDWAATSSQAWGMSEQDALAAGGTLGNIFTSMGFGQEQAAGLSTSMIELAVDTASFNNASTDDAMLAMTSALTGEYEALKKYGIVLNDTTLSQTAMTMGLGDNFQALTEQEKVLVRQQAIMDQSGNATGDFKRTQEGLANQIKIAKAEFENITATIGALFLPIVTKGMTAIGKWLVKIQEMSPGMQKVVVGIIGLVAAIGPLLIGLGMGIRVIGQVSQAIRGLAMVMKLLTMNPIGLLVMALAGLVILGIHLYKNWEPFRKLVDKVAKALKNFVTGPVMNFLGMLVDKVKDAVNAFKDWANGITSWSDMFSKIGGLLRDAGGWISDLVNQIGNLDWSGILSGAWDAIQTSLSLAWDTLQSIDWMAIIGGAVDVGQKVLDWTKEQLGKIDWMALLGKAKEIGTAIFDWAKETLGSIDWAKLLGKAKDIGSAILDWAKGLLGSVDWMRLLGNAVEIGSNILDWAKGILGSIDWMALLGSAIEIGASILQWIKDTLGLIDWSKLIGQAKEIGTDIFNWIVGLLVSIDWGMIIGKAVDVGQKVYNWAKTLLGTIDWAAILGGLKDIGGSIFSWAKEMFGKIAWSDLFGKMKDVGLALFTWVQGLLVSISWTDLFGKMKDIGIALFTWIQGLLVSIAWSDLFGAAIDLGAKFLAWLTDTIDIPEFPGWPDLTSWLPDIPDFPGWPDWGKIFGGGGDDNNKMASGGVQTDMGLVGPGSMETSAPAALDLSGWVAAIDTFITDTQAKLNAWATSVGTSATTGVTAGRVALSVGLTLMGMNISTFHSTTLTQWATWATTLGTHATTAMTNAKTAVSTGLNVAKGSITTFLDTTRGQFNTWSGNLGTISQTAMDGVRGNVSNNLNTATGTFQTFSSTTGGILSTWSGTIQGTVRTAMSGMVTTASGKGAELTSTLQTAAANAVSAVRNGMAGLSGAVSSGGSGAVGTARSIGQNISSAFAQGMESMLQRIRNAASAMVNAASDALRAKAQIQSPSKLFAGFGHYVGEGFENGIASMIPSVARTTADLVATPALHIPAGGSLAAGSGVSRQASTIINQIFTLTGEQLAKLIDQAQRGSEHAEAWQNPEALVQFMKGLK